MLMAGTDLSVAASAHFMLVPNHLPMRRGSLLNRCVLTFWRKGVMSHCPILHDVALGGIGALNASKERRVVVHVCRVVCRVASV